MHHALAALRKLKFFLDRPYPHPDISQWRWEGSLESVPEQDRDFVKTVGKDLDGLLPFPRKAPSVLQTMSGTGLCGRVFDRSLLWSAVSFRAMFFKSAYHFDHSTFMPDYNAYLDRVSAKEDEPSMLKGDDNTSPYYANPSMYGNGPHRPDVTNLRTYWTTIESDEWYPPSKVLSDKSKFPRQGAAVDPTQPLPFRRFAFEYLTYKKKNINPFPYMGNLMAYLCAVDLSYAGHVEAPTLEDVAFAMKRIDAGGIKGLICLGLLQDRGKTGKFTLNEVQDAFSTWHTFLDRHLTLVEKEAMRFDVVMCEHSLCKISRWCSRAFGCLSFTPVFDVHTCSCCSPNVGVS